MCDAFFVFNASGDFFHPILLIGHYSLHIGKPHKERHSISSNLFYFYNNQLFLLGPILGTCFICDESVTLFAQHFHGLDHLLPVWIDITAGHGIAFMAENHRYY
jgi:hypothetical protein